MSIQLLGPDGQNLRKWYARKIGKPYTEGGIVAINLYSPVVERGLEDSAYNSATLRDTATTLILDYYGKAPGTLANLGLHAVYFPTRSLSNPILQFVISETDVEDANDLAINNLNLVGDEILIDIRKITPFITYVGTAFKVYQQQLKFFNGSVTPNINFLDLLDKLKLFFENVEDFAAFNGYELSKYKSINIAVDKSNYQVTGAYLVDGQLKQHFLVKGTKYYFSTLKQGTNKYVNEIVTNFYSILLGKQSKINWTQFLHNFLPDSGIVVDYYGKPSTDTEANRIAKEVLSKAAFGPLAVTTTEARVIRQNIGRTDVQEKAFKEAKKDLQKSQLSLQKRIEIIVNEIQEVGNEANQIATILNKYNVTTLVEAALECLLFKGGFNGSVPDFIPGISPFDPAPPKISIKFPPIEFKFPVISINKALQVTVRESIKRALLGAVMSIIQTIADIIKELCLSEPNENDVQSTPAQDVIGAPDGENSPLYQCYADFGFDLPAHASFGALPTLPQTSGDTLENFLIALSPLITARELCNLFNGIAAGQVFQVINNLIDNEWPEIRPHFPYSDPFTIGSRNAVGSETANEAIEQFFLCLGNLVDPSYCTGVYNDLVPQLPDIDPCTIEDIQPFQDIMDLLNGIDEIYDPLDMNCGAGIVPALAEIETYNHAVLRLIDSILRPAQQTFISDIGGFKSIIMEPQPLAAADEEELARQEELLAFLQGPPHNPPNPAAAFFANIIPEDAQTAFEGLGNIANNLAALGGEDQTSLVANIRALMASRVLLVAPDTRSLYENIEDSFLTSGVVAATSPTPGITGLGPDEALKYYAFLTNLLLRGDGINTYGRVITYNINGGAQPDSLNIYPNPAPGLDPAADLVTNSSEVLQGRQLEVRAFRDIVLGYASDALNHNLENTTLIDLFKKKLYPFVYFSLINSFASTISKSELFDPEKLNNFGLLPKVCADGSVSNLDLLDINKIKQEALEEFANNSCIEGNYELGPVRDAGLQALVSTYMQVIVVDLILKNIFMVSKFGVDYLSASSDVINELLNQATHRILVYLGGEDALGESYNLPTAVKTAAAIVVKKLIVRDPQGFAYPISGPLTNQGQINLLQNTPDFQTTVSVDNPTLQTIAVKYLFEKRLQGTAEKVKEYFGVDGDNSIQSYLINGIRHVELPDFQALPEDWEILVNTQTGTPRIMTTWGTTSGLTAVSVDPYTRFFTLFDYVDDGKEVFDLYRTNSGDFIGSVREQRIQKEIADISKYGDLVLERYFRVAYSKEKFLQFVEENSDAPILLLAGQLLLDLIDFFEDRVPIAATSGPGGTPEYLMSFSAFKDVFIKLSSLLTFNRGGILMIPFYLAGYFPPPTTNVKPSMETFIELGDPEYQNQDRWHLSDYTLIRDWCEAIRSPSCKLDISHTNIPRADSAEHEQAIRATNPGDLRGANPQHFTTFSPDNGPDIGVDLSEYSFHRDITSQVGYTQTFDNSAVQSWAKYIERGPVEYAGSPSEPPQPGPVHTPGNYLMVHEMFDGARFGPVVFNADQTRHHWPSLEDAIQIVQSKNFKVIVRTDPFGSPRHGQVFWMMLRQKGKESHDPSTGQGGDYSSLDFFSGDAGQKTRDRKYWKLMHQLFDAYDNERDLLDSISLLNTPVLDERELEPGATGGETYISNFFKAIFPSIKMGTRLSYLTPDLRADEVDFDQIHDFLNTTMEVVVDAGTGESELLSVAPEINVHKYKSFFMFYTAHGGRSNAFSHFATDRKALVDVSAELQTGTDEFNQFIQLNGTTQGFSRYIEHLYQRYRPDMIRDVAFATQNIFGDGQIIDIARIMQYLYIIGEIRTYYSLFTEEDMFTDTKLTLLLGIQAALAGSDTTATSACDLTAVQSMLLNGGSAALTPISNIGMSFVNKMLKDTPKHILKGLVELTEPHVIVSQQVKKVSKTIFQGMEQAANLAAGASGFGSALGGLSAGGAIVPSACDEELGMPSGSFEGTNIAAPPNAPTFDEIIAYIQGQIDQNYPAGFPEAMKPQISKDGLELEGSIPYLFMLPPLTPFGILYLLLRLSEFGHETIEFDPGCEDEFAQLDDT